MATKRLPAPDTPLAARARRVRFVVPGRKGYTVALRVERSSPENPTYSVYGEYGPIGAERNVATKTAGAVAWDVAWAAYVATVLDRVRHGYELEWGTTPIRSAEELSYLVQRSATQRLLHDPQVGPLLLAVGEAAPAAWRATLTSEMLTVLCTSPVEEVRLAAIRWMRDVESADASRCAMTPVGASAAEPPATRRKRP